MENEAKNGLAEYFENAIEVTSKAQARDVAKGLKGMKYQGEDAQGTSATKASFGDKVKQSSQSQERTSGRY
jgi:hypothetical protein